MKVLHVVHQYPPEFRGGTEACVQGLAAAQLARGDVPCVLSGSDERHHDGEVRREAVDGVPVLRVIRRPGENYSMDHRCARVGALVVEQARALAPDVVHVHHTLHLSGDLRARLAEAGLTVVSTLHDFTMVCARFFLVRPDGASCHKSFPLPSGRCVDCVLPDFPAGHAALEEETTARRVTSIREAEATSVAIVPSRIVRDRWLASGLFDAARLEVVPHPSRFAAVDPPTPRDRSDGRLVLATWGHLAPAKGVADLLEAMRRLGDPRVSLHVLGRPVDDDYDGLLREAAEGLDVTFHGAFEAEDLLALRGRADLAVFPSRAEETFSLAVAEARALGFPIVVSDRGALPETLGDAGRVVSAADPLALAEVLRGLLEPSDDDPLVEWAAAARRDLPGAADHAARLDALYRRAIEARGPT